MWSWSSFWRRKPPKANERRRRQNDGYFAFRHGGAVFCRVRAAVRRGKLQKGRPAQGVLDRVSHRPRGAHGLSRDARYHGAPAAVVEPV